VDKKIKTSLSLDTLRRVLTLADTRRCIEVISVTFSLTSSEYLIVFSRSRRTNIVIINLQRKRLGQQTLRVYASLFNNCNCIGKTRPDDRSGIRRIVEFWSNFPLEVSSALNS